MTDEPAENKRKATEQLDGASPTKRIKDSLSSSPTPEGDAAAKLRVVPFPEKARIPEDRLVKASG